MIYVYVQDIHEFMSGLSLRILKTPLPLTPLHKLLENFSRVLRLLTDPGKPFYDQDFRSTLDKSSLANRFTFMTAVQALSRMLRA